VAVATVILYAGVPVRILTSLISPLLTFCLPHRLRSIIYISCLRTSCLLISLLIPADIGLKDWDRRKIVTDISKHNHVWKMLTRIHRYTNTLFVSLNNRIYFRDHAPSGVQIMADQVGRSDPSRHQLTPVTVVSTTHTTPGGDNYALKTISHTIDLEKGKSDSVSISSDPRCRHSVTEGPMRF
jgi:hypothetical protein